MRLLLAIGLIAASIPAYACRFDTDCAVGSTCVKEDYKLDGYCVGGLRPGNNYDDRPYRDRLDTSRSVGNTCQFTTDCGVGAVCLKESGQLYGTCVR